MVVLYRLDAKRGGDVGLAVAGAADQHHIVGAIDKRAAVELLDHGLVDLAGRKIEAGPSAILSRYRRERCWIGRRLEPGESAGPAAMNAMTVNRRRNGALTQSR